MSRRVKGRSTAITAELADQFEVETSGLFHRRLTLYASIVGGLTALIFLLQVALLVGGYNVSGTDISPVGWAVLDRSVILGTDLIVVLGSAFVVTFLRTRNPTRPQLVTLSIALVALVGLLHIGGKFVVEKPDLINGLSAFFFAHVIASLLLPWKPADAVKPALPVLAVFAIYQFTVREGTLRGALLGLAFSPAVVVPGALFCWLRESKRFEDFRNRFVTKQYSELRRELLDAGRIHESLFPQPIAEGPLRFDYRYEPMRQIGGDYLYASNRGAQGPRPGRLSVVLLDVTGHGIAAALTVNRLYGELERVFAENPDTAPGELLRLLNRYVHLTLSSHSVYVTALCLRADVDAGTLEYASGGHPPAFVRAVDGSVHDLPSTAFVLGACADRDFDSAPARMPFGPGDTLIAYTDGAIEARSREGGCIGVEGLRRWIHRAAHVEARTTPDRNAGWPEAMLSLVESHRFGPAQDDTLVIEIHRPLQA
ncbi:MAG: PP2C family protein-serine/threonine phosphatase [Planctomycetota bacterium]|nr:PP2C family protein-serine/threonine phosphatase [Planctomycetota bacterium]